MEPFLELFCCLSICSEACILLISEIEKNNAGKRVICVTVHTVLKNVNFVLRIKLSYIVRPSSGYGQPELNSTQLQYRCIMTYSTVLRFSVQVLY